MIIPIIWMRKQRAVTVTEQTTKLQDKWKTWDSSPGNLALEPLLLITLQYHTLSKEMITIHHRWWVPLLFFLAMY